MKHLLVLSLFSILLTACGNEDEQKYESNNMISDSKNNSDEKFEVKKQTNIELPSKEEIEKKQDKTDQLKVSEFTFMNPKGEIDILSTAFKQYYFSGNRANEFAGIRVGMTKNEVEKKFGPSTVKGEGAQYLTDAKYGDIGVQYEDGVVKEFFINPSQKVAVDEIISSYGKPTVDMNQKLKESTDSNPMPILVYDGNANNGYAVTVVLDKIDGHVRLIETTNSDISKEMNTGTSN